ncbi:type II toxin-antitoxin system Phd/YefM family antitoxin [Pseudonocardia abyssalis]|uniref:Type II toxin-antitoxin system prevent-host-death family antitoxin n=1 Tax=Pseudonocardia abyssalis TaxID=2792008 RepID=A0ABS6UWY7_9PSEU|nr:type II toxin-antitoxin system prevent-host-death family antitoxin [Pseudonocardia abyssalis]MBW0115479.1 type II toxin-antitoxin system prevent-host-death family antitoxin [Pseudonocardia abyssalis]MBW0136725.1 type II toxin-antitoxin system prevent-host-death family antitoxin [Pseudonocardia abyssalis]
MEDAAETIGIRELRQHASRYVEKVKQGQRIAVTERGELVDYLEPVHGPRTTYQRMVAAGQVRPANGGLSQLLASREPLPALPGERMLSEVLQEMRDEERY